MTENLAGRGEGLAGHSERVMRIALKAIINMAHRAWEDKASVETMFRLIGKRAKGALETAPIPEANVDDPSEEDFKLATDFLWGTDGKPTTENVLTFIQTVRAALEAAAPAGTAHERELLQAVLNCETRHDERGHAYLKVPARSLNDLGALIGAALATPSPQAPEVEAIDDRAKVERALNALDHLCDMWAEEVDLERIVKAISGNPNKVRALLRQSWIEGAYRGRTSHIDCPQPVSPATQEQPAGSGALETWLAAQRVTLSERQLDAVKGYIVMNLLPVGSPRKVGEDGARMLASEHLRPQNMRFRIARAMAPVLPNEELRLEAANLAALSVNAALLEAAHPSSVPVGEQKQEEGV